MAKGGIIGRSALTEPTVGSEPSAMATVAARDGRAGCSTGASGGLGAPRSPTSVVWAATDDGVRGFLVPTDTAAFTATPIEEKLSVRASIHCDRTLDNVRLPATALLRGTKGLRGPFSCLNEVRYGIIWGCHGCCAGQL